MTAPAIELEGVGKRYWKIQERSLARSLLPGSDRRSELWALRDANFSVEPGETVGVIGRNGAGKSTLLRLLAGVSRPTTGAVTTRGRVAPLLSVGVGFHPEMTGRENVFVNGMLLGLTRSEIAALFDVIVDFAELADFVDTPVKFYSSGMFMRLGFSVAVHVRPEILLVDEVLAVGDIGFQLRCLNRMRELQQQGTTVVFVSHALHAVHLLCPRTILVHQGRIEFDGPTEVGIGRFHNVMAVADSGDTESSIRVLHRALLLDGEPVEEVAQDQTLTYESTIRFERAIADPGVNFQVFSEDGSLAYSMRTAIGEPWRSYEAGEEATIRADFGPRLGGGGTFHISVEFLDHDGAILMSDHECASFYVPPRFGVAGPADLGASIRIDGEGRTDHRWQRLDGGELHQR